MAAPDLAPGGGPGGLTPGQLFGSYRILRLLGAGGMGAVYEAESVEDGRRIALKLLNQQLDDAEARHRFLREGHLAAALNHPNTVYIYGTGEIEGQPSIAMELVPGGTIEQRLEREGPLPVADAVEITLQIVDGLAAAHALGILHRDIKPANCFLGLEGVVKVGDFGLSRSVTGGKETRVTQTGVFIGTPAFSSPEQLLGEPLDVRSDIYAVGATLYNLLTARLPFEAPSAINMVAVVLQGSPVSPREHRPEIPERLAQIVLRCLARKPEERYPDYDAVREDLESLRGRDVVPAPLPARGGALLIDLVALIPLQLCTMLIPGALQFFDGKTLASNLTGSGLYLLGLFLLRALPQSLWGCSAGQALLDLRVERLDGTRMGPGRSLLRLLLLWAPLLLGNLAFHATSGLGLSGVRGGVMLAALLGLLSTMRRANGYRGLHDLLLGTRVVRPAPPTHRRRAVRGSIAPPVPLEGAERLGPFLLVKPLGVLADGSALSLAHDPALRRAVWIQRHPEERPPLPAARRELARAGRLRWVASHRSGGISWDAFEAPEGGSLADPALGPVSWQRCRNWLADLAEELTAAETAGESLRPGLDQVWIGSDDRAMLLDFPMAPASPTVTYPTRGAFLAAVAARVLAGAGPDAPGRWPVLPLPARALLDQLPALEEPAPILEHLSRLAILPAELTPRRRGLALALTAAPTVACATIVWIAVSVGQRLDPETQQLLPMIAYLQGAPAGQPESLVAVQRRTLGVYLLSQHPELARDSVSLTVGSFYAMNLTGLDSMLAPYRGYSPADSAAALRTVRETWGGRVPGVAPPPDRAGRLGVAAGLLVLLVTQAAALLAALCFRIGWAARMAGIEIVTGRGIPAGRLRLVLRSLLAWSPVLGILALLEQPGMDRRIGVVLAHWATFRAGGDAGALGALLLICVLVLAGLASLARTLRTPARGPADRLAGTYLVPR